MERYVVSCLTLGVVAGVMGTLASAVGNDCSGDSGVCHTQEEFVFPAEELSTAEAEGYALLQTRGRKLMPPGDDAPNPKQPSTKRPRVLLVFDMDFTLFGVSSEILGTSPKLYAEPFWDDAFVESPGFGAVWGLSRGLVPNVTSLEKDRVLGPQSVFSTDHPLFGDAGMFDTFFGIVSDGSSLIQAEFPEYGEKDPRNDNNRKQIEAFRRLRKATDFNPRWHILDKSIYTCYGKYNENTSMTLPGWKLNAIQQGCAPRGHKDVMLQNILDFYADFGWDVFDYIFFVDDQASNLRVVKEAPNLGGKYTYGPEFQPKVDIGQDKVFLVYPDGGAEYQVTPKEDNAWPCCCGGCWYAKSENQNDISPFQGLRAGLGIDSVYSHISPDDNSLSGRFGRDSS